MANQNLAGIKKKLKQVTLSKEYVLCFGTLPRPGKDLRFFPSSSNQNGQDASGNITGKEGAK